MTQICVSKLIVIGSDNGLSPGRHQAIICTNAGILSIGPLETNFSEILIEIIIVSFKKMHLKVSSAIRWPFCLGLNVLMCCTTVCVMNKCIILTFHHYLWCIIICVKANFVGSLAIGRCWYNFIYSLVKPLQLLWNNSQVNAILHQCCRHWEFRWMPHDLNDDKPTLVQVRAWCHQAPSLYLNQSWPSSMMPHGIWHHQGPML